MREPSTYRAGLVHGRRPKTAHADPSRCAPIEVKCHRCALYCASSVLRAEPPGPVCDRHNSNRHSCNDRSARALRPSPPDAARTTSSAAKTAANQRNGRHRRRTPPRGTAQLAQGPPHRLRRAAAEQGRRVDGPAELGRRHLGQKRHDVRVPASAAPSQTRIGSCLDVLSARRRPCTTHARRATPPTRHRRDGP